MVLKYEDLHNVILVGHSIAGAIITGVAEKARDRRGHLIFLDAFVPQDGQSIADMYGPETYKSLFADYAEEEGGGRLLPYNALDADG